MLRCLKCSRVYQNGTQRFCTNDGGRLLPVSETPAGQAFERVQTGGQSRRTPPGELIFETMISSPTIGAPKTAAEVPEKEIIAPTFENFGLHSSDPERAETALVAEESETENFYSFKSLRDEEDETIRMPEARANGQNRVDYVPDPGEKKKFDMPFLAVCLLGALLLVTALGFAGMWLFREQQTAPPPFVNKVASQPVKPPNALPEGYAAFLNSKEKLEGKLREKFVGFSLAYPNSWQKYPNAAAENSFLDISNPVSSGVPVEQLKISYYDSRGTFDADRELFPVLAKKLNGVYKLSNYRQVSEGDAKINGLDAYEVRFEADAVDRDNKPFKFFGRTVFLPPGKATVKSGLLITMLATDLAPDIKSAEDVGNKGQLAQILETFRLDN